MSRIKKPAPKKEVALDKTTLVVILYLIERLNGVLGKTHLQKILFLSDLLSVKKFKEPITKLQFAKYHYGPFSDEVDGYIEHLERKGVVESRKFPLLSRDGQSYFRFYFKGKDTLRKILSQILAPEKIVLLDEIISSYGNASLQEVLDVVYSLETVQRSTSQTPLEMARIIKDDNNQVEEIDIF